MRYTLVGLLALLIIATACDTPVGQPVDTSQTVTPKPADVSASPVPTEMPPATATSEPLAALVNGQSISLAAYERQVERYSTSMVAAGQALDTPEGQQTLVEGRQWVLDMMIEQKLIEQQAEQAGLVIADSDLDTTITTLRADIGDAAFDQWLADEGMSLEEMRERLRGDMIATQMANRIAESVLGQADHVHARHIVVGTAEEAQRILDQLQAGADFATLARTYSQDSSTRDLGGDLGFFPQGVLTSKEVEAAAFALQPGQTSDVITSDLGYHIVQVVERANGRDIEQENLRLLRDQAVRSWLDQLRASADIQVYVTP
jgi:parvulin-like peptidyl-prolyl isomerase